MRGKREHPRHNGDEIDSARRTARQQPLRPGESAGSQSVMVSVSQSVSQLPRSYSYRIHTKYKPRRHARRARRLHRLRPGGGCKCATPNTPWNTRPARASCSPGPWRLSGSRGCPLPLSETGKPGSGCGSWGEAISRLVFHAIDFIFHGPNHSRVVGPRTLADILDPATSNTAESPAKAMRGAQSRHDDVLAAVTDSAFSAKERFFNQIRVFSKNSFLFSSLPLI